MRILRSFFKSIPTLLLSFALALAVWVSAVNATDPVKQDALTRPVTIERVGLASSLVITGNDVPTQASVVVSAPSSILDRMKADKSPVRAWVDLSGLTAGQHTVDVHAVPLGQFTPSKAVSWSPRTLTLTLEELASKDFQVNLVLRGEPAVGFQADGATVNQNKVTVSGPSSQVQKVKEVRATLDLTQASDNIKRSVDLQALDANNNVVTGVSVSPAQVTITQPISQRGGYRNVVVKVASTGQVAGGYRLTNISVFPPTVTVFSSNPQLVEQLPGYVETSPLDLTGVKDDIDIKLPLNLPDGVEVVGDQNVLVQVGVATIEGSITFSGLPIQVEGLANDLRARISPEAVDVIISGPVPMLDRLTESDVRVYLDLTGVNDGTYQFAPRVVLSISELKVESILPSSIEVVVESKARGTLTPSPASLFTITPSPTPNR